jgi:hypothetical protein
MNIGKQRRTIYIEPIEEPATTPMKEPSPEVEPEPSKSRPETESEPAR